VAIGLLLITQLIRRFNLKRLKTAGIMALSIIFSMAYSYLGVLIIMWYVFTGKYTDMNPYLHEILILGVALLHILLFVFSALKFSGKIFKVKWQKKLITILSIFIVLAPYLFFVFLAVMLYYT
jgi:hypothetical protein